MRSLEAVVVNKLGLHARPSAKVAQLATRFQSDVWMAKGARRINAKSIMGVMMLAAAKGSKITVETDGADEAAAMTALTALIANYFEEGE